METVVAGLNRIHCHCNAADDGKTVTVSNTYQTWTKTLSSNACEFIVPSLPAPERKPYTISLMNGNTVEYTRTIELGFGDAVNIGLYEDDEPATMEDIGDVEDAIDDLESRLIGRITYGTTDLVDGYSALSTGYLYCYI